MNCRKSQQQLSRFIDGRLSQNLVDRIDAHVADCSICCRKLDELRAIRQRLGALPTVNAPTDLAASLVSHAIASTWNERSSPVQAFTSVAQPVAAVSFVVVLLLLILAPSPTTLNTPALSSETLDLVGSRVGYDKLEPFNYEYFGENP